MYSFIKDEKMTQLLRTVYIVVALMVFCSGANVYANQLNFVGFLQYEEDESGKFLESYQHTTGAIFKQELTSIMSLSENLRYSERWTEEAARHSTFSPSMTMATNSDLFYFDLSGAAGEEYDSEQVSRSRRSWESRWLSQWRKNYVPDLTFSVGQKWAYDHSTPRTEDVQQDNASTSFDWNLNLFKTHYSADWQKSTNNFSTLDSTNLNQLASADMAHYLFNDRFFYSLSHRYSSDRTEQDTTNTVPVSTFIVRNISDIRTGIDANVTTVDVNTLAQTPGLHNTVLTDTALTLIGGDADMNIAIQVNNQDIDQIYLYTATDITTLPGASANPANDFNWELYYSNDGTNWTLAPINTASITYNSYDNSDPSRKRFQIPFINLITSNPVYLKLTIDSLSSTYNTDFSEVETLTLQTITPGATSITENISNQTSASVGLKITTDIDLNYSFSMHTRDNSEFENDTKSESKSHVASLNYRILENLTSIINGSETRSQFEDQDENINRAFGININAEPLDTLDLSLAATNTDIYQGDQRTTNTKYYNMIIDADLYPDMNSRIKTDYQERETIATDTFTRNFNTRMDIGARLRPELNANISGMYNEIVATDRTERYQGLVTLSWNVSDDLSLKLSGTQEWRNNQNDLKSLSANMAMKPTYVTQLDLAYTLTDDGATTHSGTGTFRWTLTPNLFLKTVGVYRYPMTTSTDTESENNYFKLTCTLTARFSTF